MSSVAKPMFSSGKVRVAAPTPFFNNGDLLKSLSSQLLHSLDISDGDLFFFVEKEKKEPRENFFLPRRGKKTVDPFFPSTFFFGFPLPSLSQCKR